MRSMVRSGKERGLAQETEGKFEEEWMRRSLRKVAIASLLAAVGVVIAPFVWFPFLATKAYPGQHMINAITGVLLGPLWAALVAVIVGVIRMSLGIGTIYSIPGGVPGALIVGIFAYLLEKVQLKRELAAFTEPIGTIFVGATIAVYIFAPWLGHERMIGALLPIYGAWALSCVPGAILGFLVLEGLRHAGITRESLRI